MEAVKISYFEKTETPKQKEFVCAQDNCVLCNTNLEVRHLKSLDSLCITEEAFCPACDVKTRTKNHTLH